MPPRVQKTAEEKRQAILASKRNNKARSQLNQRSIVHQDHTETRENEFIHNSFPTTTPPTIATPLPSQLSSISFVTPFSPPLITHPRRNPSRRSRRNLTLLSPPQTQGKLAFYVLHQF